MHVGNDNNLVKILQYVYPEIKNKIYSCKDNEKLGIMQLTRFVGLVCSFVTITVFIIIIIMK
jgi:phosphotransferase system  glucose/maltose/N-acetylglucosamine-specific IIC component